jgi:hypothetical protein
LPVLALLSSLLHPTPSSKTSSALTCKPNITDLYAAFGFNHQLAESMAGWSHHCGQCGGGSGIPVGAVLAWKGVCARACDAYLLSHSGVRKPHHCSSSNTWHLWMSIAL